MEGLFSASAVICATFNQFTLDITGAILYIARPCTHTVFHLSVQLLGKNFDYHRQYHHAVWLRAAF